MMQYHFVLIVHAKEYYVFFLAIYGEDDDIPNVDCIE